MILLTNILHSVMNTCGVVANVQGCDIKANEFELKSPYRFHFRTNTQLKGMNSSTQLLVKLYYTSSLHGYR